MKDESFPSLYRATKGDLERFKNSWAWADTLAFKKQIHYGKLVHKQVTLVSLEMFPYFYRVCRESELSQTAQKILDFLIKNGKTSTTGLRQGVNFMTREGKCEFFKAIEQLQLAFAIAIVDREKPPRMTHVYDLIERWMPKRLIRKAELISRDTAKQLIIARMLENALISKAQDAKRFLTCINI